MEEKIRLQKYIATAGICSRRAAEEYILDGRVKVNDKVVTELGTKVTNQDIVLVDNKKIQLVTKKRYIMLNKPLGYVTTMKDEKDRKCVNDLIKEDGRYYPIGRLDMSTSGLLLLTNDGDFANDIMHPSKKIYKTYVATIDKKVKEQDLQKLRDGVDIGDYITSPALVTCIDKDKNSIEVKICEGKNRQVRRMFESLDYRVIKLHRCKIGSLEIKNLKKGEYRFLNEQEIKKIFE